MAQFWAANCEYELNEFRNSQSTKFDYVGESLAALSSYTVNYTVLIRGWFELGRSYNYYNGYCTDEDGNQDEEGEACAPYTQVCRIVHVFASQLNLWLINYMYLSLTNSLFGPEHMQ